MMRSLFLAMTGLLISIAPSFAQSHSIQESFAPGQTMRIDLDSVVEGEVKLSREGKVEAAPIQARNQHTYTEKILTLSEGQAVKTARHYQNATSTSQSAREKVSRSLRKERQLMIAQRMEGQLLVYSPNGPLTRQEWELTQEHFDSIAVLGLLPQKELMIGETWKIPSPVVQSLCLFEGLIQQELIGTFTEVKEGMAILTVAGKANGIEAGAMVHVEVTAKVRFDLLKKKLVSVDWKQKESRDQGPVGPAMEVVVTTTLQRQGIEEPAELSKSALVVVPSETMPPGLLMQLLHKDTQSRYQFLYSRDWRIVGQTESHLVLRLLERGDLLAQANITWLSKSDTPKRYSSEDFKLLITKLPGWEMEELVEATELPSDSGRQLYRVTARGNLDGVAVTQIFFLLTGPREEQVAVTLTMKPGNLNRIGTKDLSLVNAIDFIK